MPNLTGESHSHIATLPAEARRAAIQSVINENPSRMTVQLARELGVPEAEVIAALPVDRVVELDASQWEQIIRALEPLGMVHVIATNQAVTLESFGQFGGFSTWGEYFNVQTKSLDMHIRGSELSHIFAVTKPGHLDKVETFSFQFYERGGSAAFKVFLTFGGKAPSPEKHRQFAQLCEKFRKA